MSHVYTIIVCPKCEERTLPAGCCRARCTNCGCLFSVDDERPTDRDSYPAYWEHTLRRYCTPGKPLQVTAV